MMAWRYRHPLYRYTERGVWCVAFFLVLHYLFSSSNKTDSSAVHNTAQHGGERKPRTFKLSNNQTKYLAYINSIGEAKVEVAGYAGAQQKPQELFWVGNKIDIPGILRKTQDSVTHCPLNLVSKPDCSFSLFKQFFRRCGYFPSAGSWLNVRTEYSAARYDLELCHLSNPQRTISNLQTIFMDQKIRHIVTVGDLHAYKAYRALIKVLHDGDYKCKLNSTEYPHGNFRKSGKLLSKCRPSLKFMHGMEDNPRQEKINKELQKLIEENSIVDVEHFDVDSLGDRTARNCPEKGDCTTETEHIFKENLKHKPVDLLLIFPTFNTDKHTHYETVYEQLLKTIQMVEKVQAKHVIWLTNPAETKEKCHDFATELFEFDGDANGKINGLNHLLFELLKQSLQDQDSNVHSVMDLFALSQQLQGAWSFDCKYYRSQWYTYIVTAILGLLGHNEQNK